MFIRNWIKRHEKIGPEKYQPYEGAKPTTGYRPAPTTTMPTVRPPKGGTGEVVMKYFVATEKVFNLVYDKKSIYSGDARYLKNRIMAVLMDVYGDE